MKCASLALLLIPGVLLGQEKQEANQAERLFQQLEERLSKAETIQLKYKAALKLEQVKPDDKERRPNVEGLLLLQKGNKVRLHIDGRILPLWEPDKVVVISNGTMMTSGLPGPRPLDGKAKAEKAPPNLQSTFVASLTREGILMLVMTHVAGGTLAENIGDELGRKKETPSEFTMRGKEKLGETETQVIEFHLKVRDGSKKEDMLVTLWLDAKTHLPVQRVLRLTEGGKVAGALTETYEAFKLDEKIDRAQFEIKAK
jgi:outer membrane lipoprotein-sorting protein